MKPRLPAASARATARGASTARDAGRKPFGAPALVAACFAVALVAQIADTTRRFLPSPANPVTGSATTQPRTPFDLQPLVEARLFGSAPAAAAGEAGAAAPADGSLTLAGTIAFGTPAAGLALVRTPAATRLYRIGEEVVPGLRLVEVHADRIVVSRPGASVQVLAFPLNALGPRESTAALGGTSADEAAAAPTGVRVAISPRAQEAIRRSAERRAAERARELAEEALSGG